MKEIFLKRLLPILAMVAIISYFDAPQNLQSKIYKPLDQKVNLGLDLQGGTQLDYKLDLRKVSEADRQVIIDGITEVINKRVNNLGVSEPNIYTSYVEDEVHIIVELAGIKDIEEAKAKVGKIIQLEFKESVKEIDKNAKEMIRASAEKTFAKAKKESNFTLIGNEEAQSDPAKIEFVDAEKDGKKVEEIASTELVGALEKMKNGQIQFVEGQDGYTATNTGVQEKTGYFIVKKFNSKTEEVEEEIAKEVDASHIVVAYKNATSANESIVRSKKEAKKRIEEVQDKLKAGEKFEDLAVTYSDEPAAKTTFGKLVEPVKEVGGYYEPTFTKMAMTLKKGELSEIVETPFGYHIIRANDVREAHKEKKNVTKYYYQYIFYSTVPDGWVATGLTGEHFKHADVATNNYGQPMVTIAFNDEGNKLFEEITARNIGKPVAIFVGGELISAPNVNEKIVGGNAVITGNYTIETAQKLARDLNTGAIPAPIVLSGQYSIGASLGAQALTQSIHAGVIGVSALAVFMILYYGFSGVLACIALSFYALILFFLIKVGLPMYVSFFIALIIYSVLIAKILNNDDSGSEKLISFLVASFVFFFIMFLLATPIVMTLAGIAGVILSIGMAVDANVLIFERTKEELASGKEMKDALRLGFDRAWNSIRDSNFSSLITCAILAYFGSSIIKGFAINLAAGILVSMFTAITITRVFMDFTASKSFGQKLLSYGLRRRLVLPSFDIIKRTKLWFAVSGVLIVLSIAPGFIYGLHFGLDFTGGSMMEIQFTKPVPQTDLENAMHKVDEKVEADLSHFSLLASGENAYILRTKEMTNEDHEVILSDLKEQFGELSEPRFTVVGPTIGAALKTKALTALILTSCLIVLYIAFAFRKVPKEISPWRFGICAIVALLHDISFMIGTFIVLGDVAGVEIDALFITALLTIMGFSVHDTIVVFDRIRENISKAKKDTPFDEIANNALNQTMARSINTSLSTLITVLSLFLYGPESIKYFVLALLIGIIVGTYSSIFTAAPLLCYWKRKMEQNSKT